MASIVFGIILLTVLAGGIFWALWIMLKADERPPVTRQYRDALRQDLTTGEWRRDRAAYGTGYYRARPAANFQALRRALAEGDVVYPGTQERNRDVYDRREAMLREMAARRRATTFRTGPYTVNEIRDMQDMAPLYIDKEFLLNKTEQARTLDELDDINPTNYDID